MIRKYIGFTNTPTSQATQHSCDKPEVGIALYSRDDLGKHSPEDVAQYFKNELAKYHVGTKTLRRIPGTRNLDQ